MSDVTQLGTGAEFDRIRSMLRAFGKNSRGIGDDAALLDVPAGQKLVVSTDTSVENVHFKREWMTFEEIGYRSTAAALSDLAAMGAAPLGVVTAFALPSRDVGVLDDLAKGAGDAAAACSTVIVGGDLSSSETLSVTATVFGSAAHPLLRSAARPGDSIYLTGELGGARLALQALQKGVTPTPACRQKFVRPVPRIMEAIWLAEQGVNACIDLSDGLVGDLKHIAAASGAGISLVAQLVPLFENSSVQDALSSGEEYELCVTSPSRIDTEEFWNRFGIPLTYIGNVVASHNPDVTFQDLAGFKTAESFNHFVNDHK